MLAVCFGADCIHSAYGTMGKNSAGRQYTEECTALGHLWAATVFLLSHVNLQAMETPVEIQKHFYKVWELYSVYKF